MTPANRGRSLWTWFGLYIGFVGALGVLAFAFAGRSHDPHAFGWDLLALVFSYGVILTCAAAVFDGVGRILSSEGQTQAATAAGGGVAQPARPIRAHS